MLRRASPVVPLVLVAVAAIRAEPSSEATPLPDPATLEAEGAVIGRIEIRPGEVFDIEQPGQDKTFYRLANKVHVRTRVGVIRSLLLFRSGDPYSARVLAETERNLRAQPYIYDARVRAVAVRDGRVDVEVDTRDVWTLQGGVGFGRAGGKNRTRVGLQDSNFLGTGKDVTLRRTTDVDRTTVLYRYRDPNLFGSRQRMELWYEDNSDGERRFVDLARPFFSLETRFAVGGEYLLYDREETLYALGEVRDRFRQRTDALTVWAGVSRGVVDHTTRRFTVGVTRERERFAPSRLTPPVGPLPPDRYLVYPWLGFTSIQERFAKLRNLDQLNRTEDVNFGRRVHLRLGWSSPRLGADVAAAVLDGGYEDGRVFADHGMLQWSGALSGRWPEGGVDNVLGSADARYDYRERGGGVFHVALDLGAAYRLDPERQIVLGGENGLRGYPLRYLEGDRSWLLTLEQRFYSNWEPLHLAYVGAAAFVDVGNSWFAGGGRGPFGGTLADVGVGLRIASSRSNRGSMVHIDVAYPLVSGVGVSGLEVVVRTAGEF